MFDVGFAELFLLSVIGLMVLGPERLPAVAKTLGGFVRKARTSWYSLKRTVEAELAAAESANPIKAAQDELKSVQEQVADIGRSLDQDLAAEPESSPPPPIATNETKDTGDADDADDADNKKINPS